VERTRFLRSRPDSAQRRWRSLCWRPLAAVRVYFDDDWLAARGRVPPASESGAHATIYKLRADLGPAQLWLELGPDRRRHREFQDSFPLSILQSKGDAHALPTVCGGPLWFSQQGSEEVSPINLNYACQVTRLKHDVSLPH
jgi:hypothetical protein